MENSIETEAKFIFKEKRKWQIALRRYILNGLKCVDYASYFGIDSANFRKWIETHFDEDINWGNFSKVWQFEGWADPYFVVTFIAAVSMGSILNYSIFLCTMVNSPLTTAVVGATKNIAATYIGMLLFHDYTFTWINFIGINISIVGSLYYTYMILFRGAIGFGLG